MKKAIPTFSPSALSNRIAEGYVRIIDVRSPAEFRQKSIPDSENIPLDKLDSDILALLKSSANGTLFCLTCQSGVRSEHAATKLSKAGIDNVYRLNGGLDNWTHENLSIVGKDGGIPIDHQVRVAIGILILAGTLVCFLTKDFRWLAAPAFFGAGLVFSGLTGFCGLARILALMPWNR